MKNRIKELEARLQEAEETLRAIRNGEVDALVVSGREGEQIYMLKTAEHPYRVLVEAMNEGAVTLNHDGTILYCNPSFAALLKMPSERVIGATLRQFVEPSDWTRYEALVRQCQEHNSKGQITLLAADRSETPAHLSLSPLPLDGMSGVSIVVTDLSEQKRQQELVASEKLLRSILEQAAEATVVCDPKGRIIHASRRAHDLCTCNPVLHRFDEVLPLFAALPEEESPERLRFSAILESKEWRGVETVFRRNDGQVIDLLLSAGQVLDMKGKMLGCVVTLIDITERKRAEKDRQQLLAREQAARSDAEAANRLKDEFLATVSHELRTPLNAMFGWTRLLKTRSLDEATAVKAIDVIDRNARAQVQLIDDLLDISRIITGKMRLDVQVFDLVPVIEAALESVRLAADARSVRIQTHLDPQAGLVSGDTNRIQQIVWNLLSNAIKFTPHDGRVEVALTRAHSYLEIMVSDTGRGIRPEFLPFVFDRFRQSDSSSTRPYGGLGLGLAIVRELVELHGGTVRAASPGEGKGAAFTVRFPLAAPHSKTSEENSEGNVSGEAGAIAYPPVLHGVRVLVVDDERDTRDLLDHVFQECGAEVRVAASAREGLAAVQSWTPSIIVSDIGMPGEDGYAFIQRVRDWEHEHGGRIPAVALTAYTRREDRQRVLSAGFQSHVSKPAEPIELAAVVARLVGREA